MDTVNVPVEVFDDNRLSRSAKQLLIGMMWLAAGFRARKTVMARLRDLERLGWIDVSPPDVATSETGADCDTKRRANRLSIGLRNPIREEKAKQINQLEADINAAPNKGEALMRKVLDLVIPDTGFIDNYRPEFLKNPMTGQCLEYDRYHNVGVAFEFNGPQHYGPTGRYPIACQVPSETEPSLRARSGPFSPQPTPRSAKGPRDVFTPPMVGYNRRDAAALRTRDLVKRGLSAENGITLITVRAADLSISAIYRLAENQPVC